MPRQKKGRNLHKQPRQNRTKEEWEEMKRLNPELGKPKGYHLPPKTNESFENYYQGIGIVPEDEWEMFLDTMRKPLPTTFRITGSRSQAQELLKIIKGEYFSELYSEVDGSAKIELKSLPWYPDELAWQLGFTRKEIKNDKPLGRLHGFLISETESGNISRQEAVSMIPPLLMDIQQHHKILDMCAAPGSKTAQLIEMLHSDDSVPVPEGYVVANDMDNKRCYLMTHQVKRIQSPNCMIINHDARCLPNMVSSQTKEAEFVKYDRILCDVPCSGDGTMRKNPDIWGKWQPNGAYNLHKVQKKVLQRGLELLAVGGRLVYSTCSLNPVEDEAVILALIKKCEGSVEVVDVSETLKGLRYSKGTYSWKIMTKKGEWFEREDQAPGQFQKNWDSTMYPPIITEAQDAKLERCIRVLPHQQNTGAFFIAVLTKLKELPWLANRPQRRVDPIINPKTTEDGVSTRANSNEHFSFGVKHKYAKCNLCDILLQGRNDYISHKEGKKHRLALEKIEEQQKQNETTKDTDIEQANDGNERPTESSEIVKDLGNSTCENVTDAVTENDNQTLESVKDSTTELETGDSGVELNIKAMEDSTTGIGTAGSDGNPSDVTVNGSDDSVMHEAGGVKRAAEADGDAEASEEKKGSEPSSGDTASGSPPPAKRAKTDTVAREIRVSIQGHKEDPFIFCSQDDPIWPSIKQYYDISDDFGVEQIMYRNMKRVLYYVSRPIRNLVICNDDRIKFINLGVKCFSNSPSPLVPECDFRLSQEGLLAIQHHVRGRRVRLTQQDVVTILSQENPFICKLSEQTQELVHALDPGSIIFHFKPSEAEPKPNVEIVFCGWRGKTSVRSFVAKDERAHYLRMCGVELSDIQLKVREKKALREATSTSGIETPNVVPSDDEAELEQWNKEEEAARVPETDDAEGTPVGSQSLDVVQTVDSVMLDAENGDDACLNGSVDNPTEDVDAELKNSEDTENGLGQNAEKETESGDC